MYIILIVVYVTIHNPLYMYILIILEQQWSLYHIYVSTDNITETDKNGQVENHSQC